MHGSGFDATPIIQALIFGIVVTSVLANVTDTKHYIYIYLAPHIWPWQQYWRLLSWQICYTNSTEVLFAVWSLYNLRVIERIWGTRKLLSFILVTLPYTLLLPPLISAVLQSLTFGRYNYLPAGPTPLVFAILAQYHAAIPFMYQYRVGGINSNAQNNSDGTIVLSSKSISYLVPAQLALSQFPATILPAVVGWMVGYAYRYELLPGAEWRAPGGKRDGRRRIEGLRRRLESQSLGASSGIDQGTQSTSDRRRN